MVSRPPFSLFLHDLWSDTALVTPRHGVRVQWNHRNEAGVRQMRQDQQKRIFLCTAEDSINGRPITIKEKCILEANRGKRNRGGRTGADLVYCNKIALGMKVMVTNNIETDLDIANGVRGEIVDKILHPDEPSIGESDCVISLKFLPTYILVKLTRTRACRLEGLEEGVIPVEPIATSYRIKIPVEAKSVQRTVHRKQFPLTGAYAFTDYRAQGQTIPYVLVDIASPTGGLNLFLTQARRMPPQAALHSS
jgi:hypothetical protein